MTDLEKLIQLAESLAGDLEVYLEDEYFIRDSYPFLEQRFQNEMKDIYALRELIKRVRNTK